MENVKQFSGDKILKHSERIEEFFDTDNSRPITIELDMTNICNHNCPYCFGYYKRKENLNVISREEAFDIIDQLKDAGALAITFTGGGEPLVNKDTIFAMEYAKSKEIDVALITNGLALTEDISRRALKVCTWIRVSVDADSAETYKKTHGMDEKSWKIMLKNVEILCKLKKELNSECTIGVGYLTMSLTNNERKMLDFVQIFKKIGVDYSQFRPIMPKWDESKLIQIDNSEENIKKALTESTEEYDVLYSKPKYDLMRFPRENWRPYSECLGVNFTTTIAADKKVYVCCHHRGIEKYCLGDLDKEKFSDIWDKRQKVFDRIDFKDCPYFCRNNPFNIILFEIKNNNREIKKIQEKRKHKNFL